jgi:beta-glucuronidase
LRGLVRKSTSAAQEAGKVPGMLFPETNRHRRTTDLSGIWSLRLDPKDEGRKKGFPKGIGQARPIAVPASYNEQLEGARDYLGPVWYET